MQQELNKWLEQNKNPNGYFTLVQYDDGPLLTLPKDTIIFGACSGTIPLPLIYQDITNTLLNVKRKTFDEKQILCSFVGCLTHTVRVNINNQLKNSKRFVELKYQK